jgi:hypothetical protein
MVAIVTVLGDELGDVDLRLKDLDLLHGGS